MSARKTLVGRIDSKVLAFTTGKDPVLDLALAEADCIGSAAHVTMLSRMPLKRKLFTPRQARCVVAELVRVMQQARRGRLTITPEDQDIHLTVERMLTAKLGEAGKRIHTGRSRNDQVATDLRLFGKIKILDIMDALLALGDELVRFARKHRRVPMVGRTHMQPAMPGSVGLWVSAVAEGLLDDLTVLSAAFAVNDRSPLGSAAGYGVPLPLDRTLTARLLGFREPIRNVLCAGNSRGKCESVILSALAQVMITLSRFAEDMVLFVAPEFGYFTLPPEFCTGSSIMPQKSNPDVFELVRAKASKVLACSMAASQVVKGLPSGYNRDLQEIKEWFMEGLATTEACLSVLGGMMGRIGVNRDALRRGFVPGVFATDRALGLVAGGMAFRDAYDHVKAHMDELAQMNPDAALRKRQDLIDPGLGEIASRLAIGRRFAARERARFERAVTGLLGVPYPLLTGGRRRR